LSDLAAKAPTTPPAVRPHIGAFVLETLTVGMYGEPRHTIREYVQNSFDSIRAAQRMRYLSERGKVTITFEDDVISILDNGLGVPADQAWKILTSIGASKKDRQRDAGFRGIGRLAGMAYCSELHFRTTFPGETTVSNILFDCDKLLKAMNPDDGGEVELATLLSTAIKSEPEIDAVPAESHFFEVSLKGLSATPDSLTDVNGVTDYLSETAPVAFAPDWTRAADITADFKSYFGEEPETIDLFVISDGNKQQVYKPYGDSYQHAKGTMDLKSIEFISGDDNQYWGWYGRMSESAAVTDWKTRGLRVRVRNIQVDGTEIFETLFTQVKPSYGRFSSYYVGEIHIDAESVIPNARRDGFEETKSWIDIKSNLITTVCQPLASDAYDASQKGQTQIGKVVEDIDTLVSRSQTLASSSRASYDQVVDLMNSAKRLRRRAASALKVVGDIDETAVADGNPEAQKSVQLKEAAASVESVENQARMLVGRFLTEEDRLGALRQRLREEVLKEVLDVVNAFVDPATYQKIRRKLTDA
jgi:molecular chaperone HtpG